MRLQSTVVLANATAGDDVGNVCPQYTTAAAPAVPVDGAPADAGAPACDVGSPPPALVEAPPAESSPTTAAPAALELAPLALDELPPPAGS